MSLRVMLLIVCLFASLGRSAVCGQERSQKTQEEKPSPEPLLTQEEVLYVEAIAETIPTTSSVATKLPLPLRLTPASVSVVPAAILRAQDAVVLSDALVNISGATIQTQNGVHDFFLLRGFDSLSAGLVLIDGIGEPEATYYQLYNVDRVEVLKGPGSFLYGGSSLSGTVNLVRKESLRERFLHVGAAVGSFDTRRSRFDLNLGGADSPLSFRLNGMWQESDHYRDGKPSDSQAVNPALSWQISDRSVLRLNAELLSNDFSPDAGLPVAGNRTYDVPRRRSYQSPFDFSDQEIRRLRLDWESQRGSWTLRDKAYYTDLDWRSDGTLFFGVLPTSPEGGLLLRGLTMLDDRQRFLGNQFEAGLESDRHTLLLGVEVGRQRDEFTLDVGILPFLDIQNPIETATQPVPIFADFSEAGDARNQVVAPYVLERIVVSDRLQVFLGARFDMLKFDDPSTGTSRDPNQLSPLLGLVYSPTPVVSLYANLGQGFAPPSTRVVGPREPEESEQVELGLKGDFAGGKARLTLALYHLERQKIAIADDRGFTAQQGDQRSRGVEVDLAGTPLRGLHYRLAYAYTDAELTEFRETVGLLPPFTDRAGNVPAFAPEHTFNFWLGKQFRNGLSVGSGGRYVGEQFIAEDNVFEIGDTLTFDAMVSYSLRHWRWSLSGKNLTDEEYDTRGFGAFSVIPANASSVTLRVDFRL